MVTRSQVIVETLTGVKKVDLGVRPDPGALLIGLVMPHDWVQDHDALKEPPVGASEQMLDENGFSTSRLPAYRRRLSRMREEVNRSLRQTGVFDIELRIKDDKNICSKRRPHVPSS